MLGIWNKHSVNIICFSNGLMQTNTLRYRLLDSCKNETMPYTLFCNLLYFILGIPPGKLSLLRASNSSFKKNLCDLHDLNMYCVCYLFALFI